MRRLVHGGMDVRVRIAVCVSVHVGAHAVVCPSSQSCICAAFLVNVPMRELDCLVAGLIVLGFVLGPDLRQLRFSTPQALKTRQQEIIFLFGRGSWASFAAMTYLGDVVILQCPFAGAFVRRAHPSHPCFRARLLIGLPRLDDVFKTWQHATVPSSARSHEIWIAV